jgi:hypothetical protein
MKRQKFNSLQKLQEEQRLDQQQSHEQSVREFATVEQMLRHDALHTPVPPAITQRLNESIGQLPAPPRPWWRRLLGS